MILFHFRNEGWLILAKKLAQQLKFRVRGINLSAPLFIIAIIADINHNYAFCELIGTIEILMLMTLLQALLVLKI